MSLTVSKTELKSALYRMLTGSGIDVGAAEDLARAGALGAALELPVCDEMLRGLSCKRPEAVFEDDRLIWRGRVDLTAILSSLDFLQAGQVQTVQANLVAAPHMVAALAITLAPELSFAIVAGGKILMTHDGAVQDMGQLGTEGFAITVSVAPAPLDRPLTPGPISLDDQIWDKIMRLAAKSYVPASEASRASGAGAGLTDND